MQDMKKFIPGLLKPSPTYEYNVFMSKSQGQASNLIFFF